MAEDSIPYTAFTVGPLEFYECVRMPFGLANAPATFQWLMESCLGDLHLQYCIIYLDDIIVFSKTPDEHVKWLQLVFKKLDQAGLCLKLSKCKFFKKRVEYLGHIISEDGIETNPKKIEAIVKWSQPQTVTQMRSFLGFCNYYRKFIHRYAQIAKPLYKLISGSQAKTKQAKLSWDEKCEQAFKALKDICLCTPVLAYTDYTKSFGVHTDASELGLGAVLYQEQDDGTTRVIAFASCSLSNSEQRYHSSKLEFLALKWAIHDQFHEYLYGSNFKVYTDNNPLTYIMSSVKLDATAQWWVASLVTYHFKIFYQSGKQNIEANALSQIEWSNNDVAATLEQGCVLKSLLPLVPNDTIVSKVAHIDLGFKITNEDWQKEQASDPHIGRVLELMKQDKLMSYKSTRNDPSGLRVYLKFRKDLVLKNKLKGHDTSIFQFALPHSFHNWTLMTLHDDMGHLGMDRTLGLIQDRFFLPGMCESIRAYT